MLDLNVSSEAASNRSCQPPTTNSSSNATICFERFISVLRNSSSNLATMEFTAVHNITITVVSGDNFITLPVADVFKAKPGDVIGYIVDQSDSSNSSLGPSTSSNTTSSPYDIFQEFSLHGFVPYEAKVSIRIMNPGVLPLRITIRDVGSIVTDFRNLITIQRPVSGLTFNYTAIIKINTSRSVGFELSRGTNSSCDWLLIGSVVNINSSVSYTSQTYTLHKNDTHAEAFEGLETSFQYPHNVSDDITFVVNCSNKVSTLSENVTISVRRIISDFNASLCSALFAYTPAQTCWTSRAHGDHVGYKWTIENQVYRTAKVELEFHNSSLPGNKTPVAVTAWNVVSEENLVLWLDVLKNPLSIQILPSLTVASGETVNVIPVLNWSPYQNGTALYTDYGINISNALQNFIHFPTFRVKIDDSLVSRNVSNGTLVPYTFPAAGRSSVNHDVYIEAVDHTEMNRKIKVRVLDRVVGLKIDSECSDHVTIGETCTFTPKFSGSDVVCNWTVGLQNFVNNCKEIRRVFDDVGNFTVTLDAKNQISSQKTVYNITVVPEFRRSSAESSTKRLPTSSIASSVTTTTVTSFAKESKAQNQSSNIKPSSTITSRTALSVPGQSSMKISSSALDQGITALTSSITATTATLSSESFLDKSKTMTRLLSKINTSPLKPGPSSRSIDQTSTIIHTTQTLPSATILDQSEDVSMLSSQTIVSSSHTGPSSRIINPSPKNLKINGPRFAAVGEMVTFHAINVVSSAELLWVVNNSQLITSNNSISYVFNRPGEFEVIVNSSTTYQNASLFVTVQDPISGVLAFVYQKPLSKRVDVLFAIDSGTAVSYSINFGGSSKTSVGTVREQGENISVYHIYAKAGFYNVSISLFSMVGPNSTEYRKVFVNDTCKLRSAVLYGASEDIKNPSQFSDKDEIVMALKTTLDCTNVPKLKYNWKVVRLDSGTLDELPIKLANAYEAVFQFPANCLSNGHYKVQGTVENSMDGSRLTSDGYFRKVSETLRVHIACGASRMVSVDEPLTLNATVIAGSDDVTYEWFCDHVLNITCFGNETSRNTSVVRFPGNYFDVGEVYEFVVQANDRMRQGVASQKVTFGLANATLDLCLR